jgi:hypothetical protein
MKITQEIAHNIFYHVEKCWDYVYPTGQALETAVYRGFLPFYDLVEHHGSPSTIVDVKVMDNALDIKGVKRLNIVKKMTNHQNQDDYVWQEHMVKNSKYYLGIPKSVMTQVRRPTVDLQGYKGDCEKIISEQIEDYKNFAESSAARADCNKIYSIVGLYQYHKKLKIKAFSLSMLEFAVETPDKYVTEKKSYLAYKDDETQFKLSSFNTGSSNFEKRFKVTAQYSRLWSDEQRPDLLERHTVDNLIF